jgi:hypothetical protein
LNLLQAPNCAASVVDPKGQELINAREVQGDESFCSCSTLQCGQRRELDASCNTLVEPTGPHTGVPVSGAFSQPDNTSVRSILDCSQARVDTQAQSDEGHGSHASGELESIGGHDDSSKGASASGASATMQSTLVDQQQQSWQERQQQLFSGTTGQERELKQEAPNWGAEVAEPCNEEVWEHEHASQAYAGPVGEGRISPFPADFTHSMSSTFEVCCRRLNACWLCVHTETKRTSSKQQNYQTHDRGGVLQGRPVRVQQSENPFSESMRQWLTPTSTLLLNTGENSWRENIVWRGRKKRSTFPSSKADTNVAIPEQATSIRYKQKREKHHIVERTIGIDSCPHKYGFLTTITEAHKNVFLIIDEFQPYSYLSPTSKSLRLAPERE